MQAVAVHAVMPVPRAVHRGGRAGPGGHIAALEAEAVRALARWQEARARAGLMRPGPPRLVTGPMHTAN